MAFTGNEQQALRQNDQASEKQESRQINTEDVVSRQELEKAARQTGPNPDQRAAITKNFDGDNPVTIFEKNSNGTEQTVARGGQADPDVQARAFGAIHQAVQDGMHHQVAGDSVAANLFNKTPENIAAVRDAQGQAVLAASMNQGLPDAERNNNPEQAQQQVQRARVA